MVALTVHLRLVTNAWRRVIIILRAPSGCVSAHPLGPGRRPPTPEPAAFAATGACRMTIGRVNPAMRLDDQGITGLGDSPLQPDRTRPGRCGRRARRGPAGPGRRVPRARPGSHTGRSPKDKHVVRTASRRKHDLVGKQRARMAPEAFDRLYADMLAHMQGRDYFVQDLYAGRRPGAPAGRARGDRTGLARPVHPPPAAPPRRGPSWTASRPTGRSSTARPSRPTRPATAAAARRSSPSTSTAS